MGLRKSYEKMFGIKVVLKLLISTHFLYSTVLIQLSSMLLGYLASSFFSENGHEDHGDLQVVCDFAVRIILSVLKDKHVIWRRVILCVSC